MGKRILSSDWAFKREDQEKWREARVPGSVLLDLLHTGQIADPFFRAQAPTALKALAYGYHYRCCFELGGTELAEFQKLCFEGIDTLAAIYLNGDFLGAVDNMHRRFSFNVEKQLKAGKNLLEVRLQSPVCALSPAGGGRPLWGMKEALPGFQRVRKASYMFGSVRYNTLPDMGIWRKANFADADHAALDDVRVIQTHGPDRVDLRIEAQAVQDGCKLEWRVYNPDGTLAGDGRGGENPVVSVENPWLWWARGYGAQPLYQVVIALKRQEKTLCCRELYLGLRTVRLNQEPDDYGNKFQVEINGIPVFVRGADYVPEDSIAARIDYDRIKDLVDNCLYANFTCIRVWGGGYYPEDYFYELCDRHGLLVWQDLMFACAFYEITDEFKSNIQAEVRENVRRLRHHPSLVLWCGNNEIEWKINEKNVAENSRIRTDYLLMEHAVQRAVREEDGATPYWFSSPSSTGNFDDPNSGQKGDTHYWGVWHEGRPITAYQEHETRFISEFGFQSFPTMEMLRRVTWPQDRFLDSPIIKAHQISPDADTVIKGYMAGLFPPPKNLEAFVYFSQLIQARAVEYAVEFWRRQHGKCMGTLYWQLNDCCPVASWSGIDYGGNRKALHYFAKRFYKDVLLSVDVKKETLRFCVVNDTRSCFKGKIYWRLRKNDFSLVSQGYNHVTVPSLHSKWFGAIDIRRICGDERLQQTTFLEYCLRGKGEEVVSQGTYLFSPDKRFIFREPRICKAIHQRDDKFEIVLKAQNYARAVFLELPGCRQEFSDNFFDIPCEEATKTIALSKRLLPSWITEEALEKELCIHSMYDYMSEEAQKNDWP